MSSIEIAIILLTVIVVMLSVIILILLALIIAVLAKMRRLADKAEAVTNNLVSATAWLSPTTVFSAAVRAFRRK
ncbi:hypothetical protein GX865_02785 [Candidatus Saccharibacteria bacterium]|jgi:ABC-type sulfate transport system permease component|nr:hypothetical protein [Candidatus Saccharibacteria bacterium]